MPTDKERHEIATKLREINFNGILDLNEKMEIIGNVIGDSFSEILMNDFVKRLADLIDVDIKK